MSATFSSSLGSFNASSFIKALQNTQPSLWQTGVSYNISDVVFYDNSKYVATTSGVSGVSPPTHTSGIQNDGSVSWIFVESINNNDSFRGNLYLYLAKPTPWTNELTPDTPVVKPINYYTLLDDIITLQKILPTDIKLGAVRNNWVSGTVYQQYDSTLEINEYTHPFFVITDDLNIYKCLNDNNGATSTSKPTGTSTSIINLVDGYAWKYLGTVTSQDASNYLTVDYVPVEYKVYNDGSNQWNVQENAKSKSLSTFKIKTQTGTFSSPIVTIDGVGTGATAFATKTGGNIIRQILLTTCGQDYSTETYAIVKETGAAGSGAIATATISGGAITGISLSNSGLNYTNATILITGDGTGATATATIAVDTSIQSITVTNGGTGYTTAKVFVIPGTSGAVGKAVMSPINGHGSNVVAELNATSVIVSTRIQTNAYFLTGVTSDFRQVGLITDIKDYSGVPANASFYLAPAHPDYSTTLVLNKVKPGTGYLLYVNNMTSVVRSTGQEELIKIVFTF